MTSSRLQFTPAAPRDGHAAVAGEVDAYSAEQLVRWLEALRADGHRELRLDLSGTGFLDSAGLQALLEQSRAFRADGGRLRLQRLSEPVRRVLTVAGLVDQLDVEDATPQA